MKLVALVAVAACSSSPHPPAPAPSVPLSNATRGCSEAATGLERGTRSIREPETSVLKVLREQCVAEAWPAEAIDCFSAMAEGDLGRCAALVPEPARDKLFQELGGGVNDRTKIAIAIAKLSVLKVGVPECDRFIASVSHLLVCEGMPLEQRAQLGIETADFWALPKTGLPADAQRRMTEVCGKSLASLQQQAVTAGCMP